MSFQIDVVIDAFGQLVFVMCDIDECAVRVVIHVTVHDSLYQIAVAKVQSMKRFVENQQVWTFHECASQQNQSLLTTRHFKEFAISQMSDAKHVHPFHTLVFLFLFRGEVKPDGIFQSTGHNLQGRDVLLVASMHLWRYVADAFLDVPDALTRAALVSEE